MKNLSITLVLAFLACLFFSSIGIAQSNTELEKELLLFFVKNDFDVSNLNSSASDAEIISEGPAFFLGIENVQLRVVQNASDSKIKSIEAGFPASSNIDLLKLSKFSGGSLGRLVPVSLRKSSALYIKDLVMDIADDGKTLNTCELNFTGNNWDVIDFSDFQIDGIAVKLFKNSNGYGGTLSSTSNIGNAVFETESTLSSKEETVIKSTLSKAVTVNEIVTKLGGSYTQQFWLLFPNDNIKQVSIDEVEVALYPLEKLIIVRGMSSTGKMAFLFRQSGKNRSIAIEAAPATLDKIVGSSFLDAMDFESPIIVMSNFADREYQSLLLAENSTMDIAKGLNVISSVNLGRDFENIFKTSHIYFYGSIGKNKNIRLTGETKNDIPLGTSKLRFKKLDFRIATESSPAKPPSIGMEGTLNLEISESESLDFIAGMKSQIAPLQIGGWIELDAKGGNGMWENPFGMPCLGIKNLKGAISLSPSIIVSELGLGGDLHIAKKFDGSYRPIIVQLDMMLSVTDPWSSKIEGYAQQINIASFLEAITEVKLDGELRTMLSTGIESAYIQFNPKEHLFSASGDFNLMGVKSSISMGMNEQNVFAKGTMDPFEIKAGDFRVFGIYGIAGPKPSFHVELGANPHLMIDGRVVVLETMEGGALVDINSSGFYVKAHGKILGGAFTGDLEAWGKDLNSSPSLYASLSLSPSIINSVQSQLTQWMEQQGAQSAKEIEKLKKGINSGNAVIDQIGAGTLDIIKTMSTETATLGVLVSKNMIPSIKEITFKGNLDKSGANMRFGIQVQLGNQVMDPVYVDINLKGDLQSQLSQIADILKKQILAEFEDLGKGVIQQAQELGNFFEDVGKEIVNVSQDAGETIVQVTKVLDEFWNGKNLPVPFNGEQLSKIPTDYRHYEIKLTGIRCITADDQAFLGDAAVELYGGIYFIPGNMTTSRNTNDIVYSVNRDASDNNKFSSGTYKIQNATKHFYVRDGQQHGITVKVELLDSDKGGSVAEDDKIRGSKYIDLSGWQWGTDTRVSQEKITTSGSGTFEVDVKITLFNKIGEREFLLAIEHGSTSELVDLLNKGGNLQNECLLTRAIQKRDANMVNFLIANNAKYCPDDINFAFTGSDFSEPIAVNLLLKYNPTVNSGHLQQAIAINSTRVTELLLTKGLKPTNANLTQALTNKNVPMVKLLLRYNVPVTQENLNYTIYNNQAEFTRMIITAGMKPTTLQLNTAIEKSFPDVVAVLLESVKPDNESYVKAATTNNTKVFTMLTGSKVRITNFEPAKISIEKKNLDILRMALDMGGSPDQALATAIKANYPAAVDVCLSKGAKPEPALKYAIQQNNTSMFTALIKDYGANPDIALDNAFENSQIEFIKLALSLGAVPNSQIAKQANAGNEANVKLLVESGADPNLGVAGAIQNNQPQLLDYLIEKGAITNSPQDLATAVQKSSLQMVQSLVRNGSDPQGGIDMAVKMKNHEIMIFLFESGASPEGFLANASSGGDMKIVQILLDYGANPTEGIKMAIDNNKMDVAQLLLESGADPKGMLPGATGHGSVKIVTMLLERGENPNDGIEIAIKKNLTDVALVILSYNPSIEGLIPIASLFGNDRIVERLLEMGADPQEGIEEAVYKNQVSTAKLLLDHGAQVHSGKFATLAVQTENVNMLKLMVDNGSDYNIIDSKGNSLLHIAAALGNQSEILQLLLDLKLDPNLKNKEGDAPIHVAVSVRGKENLPAVETLHKGGADLNMPNAEGKLPVKIAKNNKVKKYMKDNGGVKKEK